MVSGVVALVAPSHHAERRGDSALAWGQDRTHQQELGFLPGRIGEQHCEGNENGYNGNGQGEHGPGLLKWGQARLPCPFTFLKMRKA